MEGDFYNEKSPMTDNHHYSGKKPKKQGFYPEKAAKIGNISRPTSVILSEPCRCGYNRGVVVPLHGEIYAIKCGSCDWFKNLAKLTDNQLEILAAVMPVGVGDA